MLFSYISCKKSTEYVIFLHNMLFSYRICYFLTEYVSFLQDMLFSNRICREITYHVTQHNMLFLDEPTLNVVIPKRGAQVCTF